MTTSGSSDLVAFRRALRRAAPRIARPLPWIERRDPWAVLVSEVMLQQTQTSRVIEPWERFLAAFPTPSDCADAPLSSVVRLWGGLGYHRRAKSLHDAATVIRDQYDGAVPFAIHELRGLPGVGEYTANAVGSFAFGHHVAVVDTNVGRVLARAIAGRTLRVDEARTTATALLPRGDAATFNQAMLDLGSQFCAAVPRCATCPVARVCTWRVNGGADPAPRSAGVSRPQSTFHGSDRQVRGRLLAALREQPRTIRQLLSSLDDVESTRVAMLIERLVSDGLVAKRGRLLCLAGD